MYAKIFTLLLSLTTCLKAQNRMPVLLADIDGQKKQVLLTRVDTRIQIAGRLAETSLTMTFTNEANRVLTGTLYFPLPEDATVSGYALDIKGKMIDGVVVGKAQGRRIFEKIVRQGIDPGLIEWTRGNTFKTKVFPIPAKGSRQIKVVYVSELDAVDNVFKLPMNFTNPLKHFSLNVQVLDNTVNPKVKSGQFDGLSFKKNNKIWQANATYDNRAFTKDLIIEIPNLNTRQTYVEKASDGQYYFVAYDQPQKKQARHTPVKAITIIWDFSLSRNGTHQKELTLLRSYLSKLPASTKVSIIGFSNTAKKIGLFKASDTEIICQKITNHPYDGGTHFKSLQHTLKFTQKSDLILLFSDGIANWGSRDFYSSTPVYTFSADKSTESSYLKRLSLSSGGQWFNLKKQALPKILDSIGNQTYQLLSAEIDNNPSIYPKIPQLISGTMVVTGKLNGNHNRVKLNYGFPGTELHNTKDIDLSTENAFESDLIRRFWAQKKLNHLLLDKKEKRHEITKLGKEYGLVTPYTSLIVLESVSQYVEHKVAPPKSMPDWVNEYNIKITALAKSDRNKQDGIMAQLMATWKSRVEYFDKEFKYPADFKYQQEQVEKKVRASENPESSPITLTTVAVQDVTTNDSALFEDGNVSSRGLPDFNRLGSPRRSTSNSSISIKKWDPKTPYITAIKKGSNAYKTYLSERQKFINSPAFYFDCAAYFYNLGDRLHGEKVLSNIVELDLENAALLRVIAYRLLEEKSFDLAIKVLQDVLEIREEEPQSYRDLATALSAKAEMLAARQMTKEASQLYQQALKHLEKVVTSRWDRFAQIEIIALNEYNRIYRKAGFTGTHFNEKLNTQLSDDIRIVLSWDADLTDIDLWVTEPSGEKVDFSHNKSSIGGRMSRDFTNGYGPEEYTVHKAMKGKYKIQANFYGSNSTTLTGGVTLKVDVYTKYGTAAEKHQAFSVKLTQKKDIIDLGEIEF